MARVKLDLPGVFRFETELAVRIGDVNYGRHLGNDAVLALAHEARIQFLARHGFSEADTCGLGMIMTDAVVVYKSQAFHGDVLKVQADAVDFGPCGCDFVFRFTAKSDGREIARVKTGIVFFDYAAKKIARMPDAFRAALSG